MSSFIPANVYAEFLAMRRTEFAEKIQEEIAKRYGEQPNENKGLQASPRQVPTIKEAEVLQATVLGMQVELQHG